MDTLRKALRALSIVYALVFLTGALLHAGVTLGPLSEPVIVPAMIVETLCGTGLLVAAWGALTGRPWAAAGLVYAHAGALAGVLLGVVALTFAPGDATALNAWYHAVLAVLLSLGLGGSLYVSRAAR